MHKTNARTLLKLFQEFRSANCKKIKSATLTIGPFWVKFYILQKFGAILKIELCTLEIKVHNLMCHKKCIIAIFDLDLENSDILIFGSSFGNLG